MLRHCSYSHSATAIVLTTSSRRVPVFRFRPTVSGFFRVVCQLPVSDYSVAAIVFTGSSRRIPVFRFRPTACGLKKQVCLLPVSLYTTDPALGYLEIVSLVSDAKDNSSSASVMYALMPGSSTCFGVYPEMYWTILGSLPMVVLRVLNCAGACFLLSCLLAVSPAATVPPDSELI